MGIRVTVEANVHKYFFFHGEYLTATCSAGNDGSTIARRCWELRHIRRVTAVNVDGGEFAKWSRRKFHRRFADRDA